MCFQRNKFLQAKILKQLITSGLIAIFVLYGVSHCEAMGGDCNEKYSFVPMESVTLKLGGKTHVIAGDQNRPNWSCYVLVDETQDNVSKTFEELVEVFYSYNKKYYVKCTTLFENYNDEGSLKREFELYNANGEYLYRFKYENTDEAFYILGILDSTGDMIVVRNEGEFMRIDKNGPVSIYSVPKGRRCFNRFSKKKEILALKVVGDEKILFWNFRENSKTSFRSDASDGMISILYDGCLLVGNTEGKSYRKIMQSGLQTTLPITAGVWCGDINNGFALFDKTEGKVNIYDLDGRLKRKLEINDPNSVCVLEIATDGEWVVYMLNSSVKKPFTDLHISTRDGDCLLRIEHDKNLHFPWINSINDNIQLYDDSYRLNGYIRLNK